MALSVFPARTPSDIITTASLFQAYVDWLDLDLSFQSIAEELSTLPGKYSPPRGEILLVRRSDEEEVIGCVALRPFTTETCELKRLFVSPLGRNSGAGGALLEAALDIARSKGYQRIVLDTLAGRQDQAISLYKKRGFEEIAPYYQTPLGGTLFLSKDL